LNLDFLDLVPEEPRDVVPNKGAIRLVTLQSIRGLSASHVIIFDLPQLENWLNLKSVQIKPPLVNLTYIALSRSKSSTVVVLDGARESQLEKFLLNTFVDYQELNLKMI
jgi:hypothetical protein